MAIAGFSVKTGAKGSAVAHAAYVARTGAYERYTEQGEVLEAREHGNMPAWAEHDPSRFWQAADAHERANGSSYREFLISLPRELSSDERQDLVKEFVAQELGETHAYQYSIHVPRASDGLDNPHVHLMFSERRADGIDRDPDQYFKRFNAAHPERGGCQKGFGAQPGVRLTAAERKAELKALRARWGVCVNAALERARHSVRVNMKSYADRGLDIQPEPKQLPSAWRGEGRAAVLAFREARAAELEARRNPAVIIDRVSSMKALFTRQDLYRLLNAVTDDPVVFNEVKTQLDAHPHLVPLETGAVPGSSREWLTTVSVLETEQSISALGQVLSEHGSFGLSGPALERALMVEPRLSDEQVAAVTHVTGDAQLAIVAGVAGSGKSTLLSVVRDGYENAGYQVCGVALAGKAADELRRSSGIESRTLASWLYRLDAGMLELTSKDVIVVDEAGMVHNGTMNRVLDAANRSGAKVILVGDAEQLQPIQAGCPFRSLSDAHGMSRIDTVRRQSNEWQREATQALSRGEGRVALSAYAQHGHVHTGTEASLVPKLVKDYLSHDTGSSMILAHRRVDVAMLNTSVREARKAQGELCDAGKIGAMEVAVGDRVVFTKNDSGLGVLNGQFGQVTGVHFNGLGVTVQVDDGALVKVSTASYTDLQHGYASTIHKSQGMTVDRAMLWGSASLDRHLGYVGMSRHREQLDVYQPLEATRVRSLDACLSRSTRAVSVNAVVRQRGLEYAQGVDGRVRLKSTYPTAAIVDKAKAARAEAETYARAFVQKQTTELTLAASKAVTALSDHRENEPPGRRKRDALRPGANQRWVDWTGKEAELKLDAAMAERNLDDWNFSVERKDHEQTVVRTRLNSQSLDLLSTEGGVEQSGDGRIVITERYPEIAREKANTVRRDAQRNVRSSIRHKQWQCVDAVKRAESHLAHHRTQEPTDSKFAVFLYQGPKEAREAWEAKLPILEGELHDAKDNLHQWEASIKDGTYERNLVWKEFSANAPDASQVNHLVLKAEQTRAEFAMDVRNYHRVEKALESTLGRSLKKDAAKMRDQLLVKFGRDSYRERLPGRVREQANEYRKAADKAQELKRSLSRGRDRGLGW